ncbi:Serine/threonine-protein kinase pakC [Smittium mucronatum]|uniref:Serine/threonine-protein kinase pakC n=1 Tax=Smittium mucronatum TaxID=133383 RepID=A0A1R0H0T5_9FUNG|nr:Serine/threonine-protein kinase pakC [Smittium mucronatum]
MVPHPMEKAPVFSINSKVPTSVLGSKYHPPRKIIKSETGPLKRESFIIKKLKSLSVRSIFSKVSTRPESPPLKPSFENFPPTKYDYSQAQTFFNQHPLQKNLKGDKRRWKSIQNVGSPYNLKHDLHIQVDQLNQLIDLLPEEWRTYINQGYNPPSKKFSSGRLSNNSQFSNSPHLLSLNLINKPKSERIRKNISPKTNSTQSNSFSNRKIPYKFNEPLSEMYSSSDNHADYDSSSSNNNNESPKQRNPATSSPPFPVNITSKALPFTLNNASSNNHLPSKKEIKISDKSLTRDENITITPNANLTKDSFKKTPTSTSFSLGKDVPDEYYDIPEASIVLSRNKSKSLGIDTYPSPRIIKIKTTYISTNSSPTNFQNKALSNPPPRNKIKNCNKKPIVSIYNLKPQIDRSSKSENNLVDNDITSSKTAGPMLSSSSLVIPAKQRSDEYINPRKRCPTTPSPSQVDENEPSGFIINTNFGSFKSPNLKTRSMKPKTSLFLKTDFNDEYIKSLNLQSDHPDSVATFSTSPKSGKTPGTNRTASSWSNSHMYNNSEKWDTKKIPIKKGSIYSDSAHSLEYEDYPDIPSANTISPDQYSDLRVFAEGENGFVYSAFDNKNKIEVAIKSIPSSNSSRVATLGKEIRLLRYTHCLNVVNFYGTTNTIDSVWMVMEYMDKGSLTDILEKYPSIRIPPNIAAYFIKSVLMAVVYIHSCSIIHTDIRSDNILINSSGTVKLGIFYLTVFFFLFADYILNLQFANFFYFHQTADLGLAESCLPNQVVHRTIETLYWSAPESIKYSLVSQKTDVYSVGVVGYEIMHGNPPYFEYPDSEASELIKATGIQSAFDSSNDQNLDTMYSGLISLIRKACTYDPDIRPDANFLLSHPFLKKSSGPQPIISLLESI